MAGVLAYGDRAVLSHRSAAALWGLLTAPSPIDVTVPGRGGRANRLGIRLHRSSTLLPSHCTLRQAIPVTKPARTIADLRGSASVDEVRKAIRQAEFLNLPLGAEAGVETELTRSRLERRFLALCRRHRQPRPEVNVRIGPYEVDFLWRDRRLVVEVDGWESHRTRSAFEEDRARDAQLKVLGYEVVRFTWRQVTDDPSGIVQTLRALLG
jgi:very-short-patch-repair endonuclease